MSRGVAAPSAFRDFAREHGVSNIGVQLSASIVTQLLAGKLPPNHPYRPVVAGKLGVPAEELAPFCKGKPMTEAQVQRLTTRLTIAKQRKTGTALVHVPKKGVRLTARGKRNSLKRQGHDLREAVRGMLTTTNIAVMKGDRYVANLPTEALYLVLTDYAERRGIKTAVVLHPKFAELFD